MVYIWSIILLVIALFALTRYFKAIKRNTTEQIPAWKKVAFIAGIIVFIAVQVNPFLVDYTSTIFFAYVMQYTISFFIVPILIYFGLTDTLMRPFYEHPLVKRFLFLTKPAFALPLFTVVFSISFAPFILDVVMENYLLRIGTFIIFFIAAFIMWWPVVSPAKNGTAPQPLFKIVYLVLIAVFMTPLAAYLTMTSTILYDTFQVSLELYNISPVTTQQVGGMAMKFTQLMVIGMMIAYSFNESVKLDRKQMPS